MYIPDKGIKSKRTLSAVAVIVALAAQAAGYTLTPEMQGTLVDLILNASTAISTAIAGSLAILSKMQEKRKLNG